MKRVSDEYTDRDRRIVFERRWPSGSLAEAMVIHLERHGLQRHGGRFRFLELHHEEGVSTWLPQRGWRTRLWETEEQAQAESWIPGMTVRVLRGGHEEPEHLNNLVLGTLPPGSQGWGRELLADNVQALPPELEAPFVPAPAPSPQGERPWWVRLVTWWAQKQQWGWKRATDVWGAIRWTSVSALSALGAQLRTAVQLLRLGTFEGQGALKSLA